MGVCEKCSGGKQECLLWQSHGSLRELLTHLPDLPSLGISNYTVLREAKDKEAPGHSALLKKSAACSAYTRDQPCAGYTFLVCWHLVQPLPDSHPGFPWIQLLIHEE